MVILATRLEGEQLVACLMPLASEGVVGSASVPLHLVSAADGRTEGTPTHGRGLDPRTA
jgi:hypothetical protein